MSRKKALKGINKKKGGAFKKAYKKIRKGLPKKRRTRR